MVGLPADIPPKCPFCNPTIIERQSVAHIHVHAIPCPEQMDLTRVFNYRPPISKEEMKLQVDELKPWFEA